MKISKFNTGVYNILLIEVKEEYLEGKLDKMNKIFTINDVEIDLTPYLDENTREIKVLGLLSNLRERHFRSLVLIDKIFKLQNYTQKFTKKFYSIIDEEWDKEPRNTLLLRI